ncbi:hypothetical protein SBFV3_gp42 [Sulfolobales Beppu filamentous virus 3]|uniref:Uncharacterized protein n=1 Tax=Sulfolobales Beppu filamentous virus 3 TaxID=2493124 RepID=A0A3Q8Q9D3_9VIRU|nr:hypothetical protein HOU83_gp42 [Sulfolobales Beppu filamentous virus 3]AZI75877.1 hypothetical protein SBFV3_gp42 [Sulfolobales Beppu filamentous virus 3]
MQFHRTIRVYDERVIKPALEHHKIVFLRYTERQENRNYVMYNVRVMVSRLVTVIEHHIEDGIEYITEDDKQDYITEIYGILTDIIPSPHRIDLAQYIRYSGYDTVDEWIDTFCKSLSKRALKKTAWLCLHHARYSPHGKAKQHYVYLYVVNNARVTHYPKLKLLGLV